MPDAGTYGGYMCGYEMFFGGIAIIIISIILLLFRMNTVAKAALLLAIIVMVNSLISFSEIHVREYKPTPEDQMWHDRFNEMFGIEEDRCPWEVGK